MKPNEQIKDEKWHKQNTITDTYKGTINKRDLYLGIIYPGGRYSWQMIATLAAFKYMAEDTLNVIPIIIEAGKFSHRHQKDKADKYQCQMRQKYLDAVPDGEWLFVLDSDEIIFGALDNISRVLDLMDANDIDFAMIPAEQSDGHLSLHPRLIKKREGLIYGGIPNEKGVMWKHDHIRYDPIIRYDDTEPRRSINYIDVHDEDRSYTLNFLKYFHYKNGNLIHVYPRDNIVKVPKNFIELEDLK